MVIVSPAFCAARARHELVGGRDLGAVEGHDGGAGGQPGLGGGAAGLHAHDLGAAVGGLLDLDAEVAAGGARAAGRAAVGPGPLQLLGDARALLIGMA